MPVQGALPGGKCLSAVSAAMRKFVKMQTVLSALTDTADPAAGTILEKAVAGDRLEPEEAVVLYERGEAARLGLAALAVKERLHGRSVFFNRNFHIEPTNVCVFACRFCSYSRLYKHREEGWELSAGEMLDLVKRYDGIPITEVHIVGGVHPKMDLQFFCDLIAQIRRHRPGLHIKAFTAVELDYMIRKAGLSYADGLRKLADAGLSSLPGGGAEIFDEAVRDRICADKCTADQWLAIHEAAHGLGLPSNATMLYGHYESYAHRVDHMNRLRTLQDRTGGFNAFIPLKFRNQNNEMSDVPEVTLIEDLKNYAVARLFLDNIPHLKAYWPMIGKETTRLALAWGVDDIDGTIDDSTKIYSMAGAEEQNPRMTTDEITELIRQGRGVPVERDSVYNTVRTYPAEGDPDRTTGPA